MYEDIKIDSTCQNLVDYIQSIAQKNNMQNTMKALRLAIKMHDKQFRKSAQKVDGVEMTVPYVYHCLQVCDSLIEQNLPLTNHELDILYASALLHDTLEDCSFRMPKGGIELVSKYKIDKEVYDTVKLLTKQPHSTEEQLFDYFETIKTNKLALLIKISDRNNNVNDLYNMHDKRLKKYIDETRTFVGPLFIYGKKAYPELSNVLSIYKCSIDALINSAEKFLIKEELLKEESKQQLQAKDKVINKYVSNMKNYTELSKELEEKNKKIKELESENKKLWRENSKLKKMSKTNSEKHIKQLLMHYDNYVVTTDLESLIESKKTTNHTQQAIHAPINNEEYDK